MMRSLKYCYCDDYCSLRFFIFISFLVLATNTPIQCIKAELTPADRERLNSELQSLNDEMGQVNINTTPSHHTFADLESSPISFEAKTETETETEVKDSVSTIASARKIPPKDKSADIIDPLEKIDLNDLERRSLNEFN